VIRSDIFRKNDQHDASFSPRSRAYRARQAAESRLIAARNAAIIKELKKGTSTVKALAARHGIQRQPSG
jgi:hypothetical protein